MPYPWRVRRVTLRLKATVEACNVDLIFAPKPNVVSQDVSEEDLKAIESLRHSVALVLRI